MPNLTLFLLKLGTDWAALKEYKDNRGLGPPYFKNYLMANHHLTSKQADVVADGFSGPIQDAVTAELAGESSFGNLTTGLKLTFYCETNHIELPKAR